MAASNVEIPVGVVIIRIRMDDFEPPNTVVSIFNLRTLRVQLAIENPTASRIPPDDKNPLAYHFHHVL